MLCWFSFDDLPCNHVSKPSSMAFALWRLFKRLYVLTHSKEKVAYDDLRPVSYSFDWREICGKLSAKGNAEGRIRAHVQEKLEKEHTKGIGGLSDQIKTRLGTADPLILLDIPVKALSRSIESESIYYMPEDIGGSHSAGGGGASSQ